MRCLLVLWGVTLLSSAPVRALDATAAEAVLQAVYETRLVAKNGKTHVQRWTFRRHPNWVEYDWHDLGVSEHWRIDARRNVSYTEIFHRERTIVRYTSGDLATLGIDAQWQKLHHVIVPPRDSAMSATALVSRSGHSGQRYRGQHGASPSSVVWLEDLQIPAEVRGVTPGGGRVYVQLVEVKHLSDRVAASAERSYRTIDFADFGDMEYDPFVRQHSRHSHQPSSVRPRKLRTQ